MKKFSKILAVLLTICLTLTLAACSSYGKVEKAFKDAGYSVTESALIQQYEKAGEEYGVKAHYLEKQETLAKLGVIILEFKATDDMIEYYNNNEMIRDVISAITSSEDAQEFYNTLVEVGFANGNCLVFPANTAATLAINSILQITKNA